MRRLLAVALLSVLGLLAPGAALANDLEQAAASTPAPSQLDVDGFGNVFVTDYTGNRVLKYAPDGTLLAVWGTHGYGLAQFSGPFGVAVDDHGAVYVADQLNNRVQKFTSDGTFLNAWGGTGSAPGQLRTPFGLLGTGSGVYVADFGNNRVQLFSPDGQLVGLWGSRGSGPGQFTRPAALATDLEGSLYVADHFNNRVQKFAPDGEYLSEIGVAVGPTVRAALAAGARVPDLPPGQLLRPEGLALDRDGNLYVADYGRHRVARFAPDGALLGSWGGPGFGAAEFNGPKGLTVDRLNARVYVADTGNGRIQRFFLDGTLDAIWTLPSF